MNRTYATLLGTPAARWSPARCYDTRTSRCDNCERRVYLTRLTYVLRVADSERVTICDRCKAS